MAKVEDVARSALAALDSTAGLVLCSQWVAERYRQFVRRARLRHMRTVRTMTLPAPISTGTFEITRGSATCIPDVDTIASLLTTTDYADYRIRFAPGATWYTVESYNGAVLKLTSEITDSSAVTGYLLVRRFHALPPDVRWATSFVHQRFHRELKARTQEELNLSYPGRMLCGPPPVMFAEAPRDAAGAKRVEFYPYSTEPETVCYMAWAIPPVLMHNDEIPPEIDTEMLKEGTIIDIMRWEMIQALRRGSADAAALLRNDMRAQETQWYNKHVPEATAEERSMDDVQIILETMGGDYRSRTFADIRDARDQVWSQ